MNKPKTGFSLCAHAERDCKPFQERQGDARGPCGAQERAAVQAFRRRITVAPPLAVTNNGLFTMVSRMSLIEAIFFHTLALKLGDERPSPLAMSRASANSVRFAT